MPIVVKNYVWQQTQKHVTIKIPLKNVHKKHVDLLTTKCYIKASYSPYFFELFLLKPIDETRSNCYIQDEEIVFELCKVIAEEWNELEACIEKAEKVELKKKYLEEIHSEAQQLDELKVTKKCELKREAVRNQIAIDTKFRETVAAIKKKDTESALRSLKLCEPKEEEEQKTGGKVKLAALPPIPIPTSSKKEDSEIRYANINNYKPSVKTAERKNPEPTATIPLPRKSQTINIAFTNRVFPTPSRESKAQEENEWLAKQAEARRSAGFVDEDLRPEERNPQWLQDKGDEFFKVKNYLAAISAYTTGIKLSKNLVSLYVRRSAAQYELGNLHKCIDDCSTALELMTPVCEANRMLRAECIGRRGRALIKLGLPREGKGELQAALKLAPGDETLQQELAAIKEQD